VDVFDALPTQRHYKEAGSFEKAADEIISQRGRQFDPDLVDIFQENLSRFRDLYRKADRSD
jgi:putative two-component system response regulator